MSSSSQKNDLPITPEMYSLNDLLRMGINHIRQGEYSIGLPFFILVREQLANNQGSLALQLDAIIQGCVTCCQAQEALFQASRILVREESEQQMRLEALSSLLPMSETTIQKVSQAVLLQKNHSHTHEQQSFSSQFSHSIQLQPSTVSSPTDSSEWGGLPGLHITCFGHFEVWRAQQQLVLCHNRNGQTILRYLMAQPGYRATIDMLIADIWHNDEPDAARHKLQVSVSALRRSLNDGYDDNAGGGYILCKNHMYQINPAVPLSSDMTNFLDHYETGRQSSGPTIITHYEQACQLYTGPFLAEDTYADWSFQRREQLHQIYLTMCITLSEHALASEHYDETIRWATILLQENQCDEQAHRHLILAYARQGRRSEALRQYQRCERILREELGVEPMSETTHVFQSILTRNNKEMKENQNRAKLERK